MKYLPPRFRKLLLLSLLFPSSPIQAQHYYEFGFTRNPNITVIEKHDTLPQPWVGGLNSVRFSEIDLDLDGQNDLVAFEKHGNRILPFLQQNNHYRYTPQYISRFPKLHDWAIFKDYDHDSQADIFTYGLAGISVYHNCSQEQLQFQLVTDQLNSYYYNGYINVFSSPDDYLVVDDVDGDGNIDLLNFWVLGKYVHYQRNYGNYASAEPFDFHLEDDCWGKFSEAADNYVIHLNTNCEDKFGETHERHVGSSMLLHDFDDNGLADLLLGDVDSPHLIMLYNHGTPTEACMTSQDTCFPAYGQPVDMYSMPAPALIQLPNHDSPSLIVSPSDPDLTKSIDLNSVWQYDYDTVLRKYTLVNTAFLQEEMIDVGSGCYPVLFDWNGDGLTDLFLSNYGSYDSSVIVNGFVNSCFSSSIRYYQNVGTQTQPAFSLADDDFGHLKANNYRALYPAFGDFTGDGLPDVVCGQKDGTLLLFPHARFIDEQSTAVTTGYLGADVGDFSTPQFFDLDRDGKKDLIIGNRRGLLSYWHNTTVAGAPVFQRMTDTLGQVDVRDYTQSYFGYSVPCFYRDALRGTILFCGNEQGHLFAYRDIDDNLEGTFTLADSMLAETFDTTAFVLDEGRRVGIAVAELNGDHYPDLLVGNYAGGVAFFDGSVPMINHTDVPVTTRHPEIELFPNPASGSITLHSDRNILHIILYDLSGRKLLEKDILSNTTTLDLQTLTTGLYLLSIELSDHTFCRKKIIKKS